MNICISVTNFMIRMSQQAVWQLFIFTSIWYLFKLSN